MVATCEMATVVGGRLKRARKAMKMKQEALAIEVGYASRAAIAQIENGLTLPSVDKAIAMARTLNVRIGWLLGDERDEDLGHQVLPTWAKEQLGITRRRLTDISQELDALMAHE